MTLEQAYQQGRQALRRAGVESPSFDAVCLFERAFGYDRQGLLLHGGEPAPEAARAAFEQSIRERAQGRPLQYILGEWTFLSLTLQVGEGVLIPREDTEVLVRTMAQRLPADQPVTALDLCAGSGAVGLGLASLCPNVTVTGVEWYDAALAYLQANLRRYPALAVDWRQADVLDPDTPRQFAPVDAILSNPPYIESGELGGLQDEVQHEPRTALDGGADGLVFYRALARHWTAALKPGGILAVEVGEGQARAVQELFAQAGLTQLQAVPDFGGVERVVVGVRQAGQNRA